VLSRAKVVGPSITPFLTLLSLGLLCPALIASLGALLSTWRVFAVLAHLDLVPGLLAGAVALLALLVDLALTTPGTAERHLQTLVCAGFALMMTLFTVVWSVVGERSGNPATFGAEVLALVAGIVSAWLARGVALGRLPGLPVPPSAALDLARDDDQPYARILPAPAHVLDPIPLIPLRH
jgi:uncharacterized membrane protein